MANNRMERANSEINRCLSEIIDSKLQDPRFDTFLTITNVKTAPDFRFCKVSVSIMGNADKQKELISLLQKSEGFIKHQLSEMVNMPSVPKLDFELDMGAQNSMRINEILNNLDIPEEEKEDEDE